jgi:hypothetical protein
MLPPEDEARLDSLALAFRTAFQYRLGDVRAQEDFTDRLVVTVPARHRETGDIVVWLDGDEVTVGIGEHFHCHFETYLDESVPQPERERLAAERAVDFIASFMTDTIVIRVTRERGRVVSAGAHPVETLETSEHPNETDYIWSGPRPR